MAEAHSTWSHSKWPGFTVNGQGLQQKVLWSQKKTSKMALSRYYPPAGSEFDFFDIILATGPKIGSVWICEMVQKMI